MNLNDLHILGAAFGLRGLGPPLVGPADCNPAAQPPFQAQHRIGAAGEQPGHAGTAEFGGGGLAPVVNRQKLAGGDVLDGV